MDKTEYHNAYNTRGENNDNLRLSKLNQIPH